MGSSNELQSTNISNSHEFKHYQSQDYILGIRRHSMKLLNSSTINSPNNKL